MAKNEAKIKFTAETGDFNNSIKQSKDQMSLLNAQMKLNETQMKATGTTVEGLEQKQKLLTEKQKEQHGVVEALNGKLQKAVECFGENSAEATKLKTQLTNAQIAEEKISQEISKCNNELEEQKTAVDDAEKEMKDLDGATDDAGDGFTIFKGVLADLASSAIQFCISKISEFAGWITSLPEATRALRQDLSTLTTAYDNVGFSTEIATNTWRNLYAVLGEDDRAVEAANNIARMAKNEEELNEWVTITTGIWGTYQDALPVEALAESAGETAKVGQVTGNLADALNWSSEAAAMFADYMSEDVTTAEDAFNVALSECTTEAERQALITDTLTALYGDAATEYENTAGSIMDANKATADNILKQNELGATLEPLTTKWTNFKTELLTGAVPALEKAIGYLESAKTWINENKTALTVIATTIGIITGGIVLYNTVVAIKAAMDAAQVTTIWGLVAAHIAQAAAAVAAVAPYILIVAAIAAVIAIIVLCIKYWDNIVLAVKNAWEWIKATLATVGQWIYDNVIAPVVNFFVGLWEGIKAIFVGVGTWVYDNIIAPVVNFVTGLWQSFVDTFHMIIDPWIEIIKKVATWFYDTVIAPVVDFFKGLWEDIKSIFTNLWEDIKGVWNAVSTWFNDKVIQPVKDKFTGIWTSIKDGAKKAWEGIKGTFSAVANWFKDIFSSAWQKVKDVFSTGGKIFDGIKEGIASVFKTVVNGIIGGINKVIKVPFDGINAALTKIKGISILDVKPFDWIKTISTPQIPLLAEGGILTGPTLNIAGEAGPEAIIPIEKLQSFMDSALERSMQRDNISLLVAAVEDLANRPIEMSINGQKFAVATAADTDTVNGGRIALRQRGLAL